MFGRLANTLSPEQVERIRLRTDGALDLVNVRGEPAGGPEFRLQRM